MHTKMQFSSEHTVQVSIQFDNQGFIIFIFSQPNLFFYISGHFHSFHSFIHLWRKCVCVYRFIIFPIVWDLNYGHIMRGFITGRFVHVSACVWERVREKRRERTGCEAHAWNNCLSSFCRWKLTICIRRNSSFLQTDRVSVFGLNDYSVVPHQIYFKYSQILVG